ncbi:hypothetical protein CVT24_012988, partial [Panaeolus cyanescens]
MQIHPKRAVEHGYAYTHPDIQITRLEHGRAVAGRTPVITLNEKVQFGDIDVYCSITKDVSTHVFRYSLNETWKDLSVWLLKNESQRNTVNRDTARSDQVKHVKAIGRADVTYSLQLLMSYDVAISCTLKESDPGFDVYILEDMVGLMEMIPMTDHSFANQSDANRSGSLSTLVDESLKENGRILSAFIPLSYTVQSVGVFSIDVAAWLSGRNSPLSGLDLNLPNSLLNVGAVYLKGASERLRMSKCGFCRSDLVKTGVLLLLVLRPTNSACNGQWLSDAHFSDTRPPSSADWHIESVILRPGMSFVQRPNTLYRLYAIQNSIVESRYFYSTYTMVSTAAALAYSLTNSLVVEELPSTSSLLLLKKVVE